MRSSRVTRLIGAGTVAALVVAGGVPSAFGQGAANRAGGTVTFAKDVMPILQRACQDCHRPGAIAPMSLLTYEDVRPWARAIKTRTERREMPPWAIERNVGISKFKDDISLSDAEVATIGKWVDAGAPLGNPADMPPAKQFADLNRWAIGTPDLILTMDKPIMVPAKGSDNWPDVIFDPKLTEDRYIKAVETKPAPNSHTVIHHATTQILKPGDDGTGERGDFLNEYALGKNGDIFEDGSGRLLKAGSRIKMGLHLHSNGEDTPGVVSLGLKFYPKGYVPKHIYVTQHMGDNNDLDIPANTKDVRFDGYTLLTKPATVTAFQGHLHNRGSRECMEAIVPPTNPDGSVKTGADVLGGNGDGAPLMRTVTLSCTRWDFNWHTVYNYADDVAPVFPAGTIIHVTTWFDNTAGNKANPDPFANVGHGNRSIEEMSFAWVSYYYMTDEEYKEKVAARRAQATNNQQQ